MPARVTDLRSRTDIAFRIFTDARRDGWHCDVDFSAVARARFDYRPDGDGRQSRGLRRRVVGLGQTAGEPFAE